MGEFKAASFKLATKAQVPIVPVTIDGTYRIMEANNNWIKPETVHVTFHAPIQTKDLNPEETAALPQKVADIIQGSLK